MSESLDKLIFEKDMLIKQENTDVPIKEYIRTIRNKYYPELDISFMDFFMKLCRSKKSVSAELLATYGVLSIESNRKTLRSTHIERFIKKCHLTENVDYDLRAQLGTQIQTSKRGGGAKYKNMYYLTPKAFKICLINSENENKYREYYLFLEECIEYYNIGQVTMYKNKAKDLEEELDSTNEELGLQEDFVSKLERIVDKQSADINRLINEIHQQTKKIEEQTVELSNTNDTLKKIVKKLDDRAIPPPDNELTERFVLMKKNNMFYVIRSQERTIEKAIRNKESLGYYKIPDLIESEVIPNSIYLWNCIKDILIKENKISCRYNEVKLVNITEDELISIVKDVFDSRKELN